MRTITYQKKIVIEFLIVTIAATALFIWVIPHFLRHQRINEIRTVEKTLEAIAQKLAENPTLWGGILKDKPGLGFLTDAHHEFFYRDPPRAYSSPGWHRRMPGENNPSFHYSSRDVQEAALVRSFSIHLNPIPEFQEIIRQHQNDLYPTPDYYFSWTGKRYPIEPTVDIEHFAVYTYRGDQLFMKRWDMTPVTAQKDDNSLLYGKMHPNLQFDISNGMDSRGFLFRDSRWAGWKITPKEKWDIPLIDENTCLNPQYVRENQENARYRLPWDEDFQTEAKIEETDLIRLQPKSESPVVAPVVYPNHIRLIPVKLQ